MTTARVFGRRSSHFTRVALVVAHELGVPVELVPIHDMTSLGTAPYGGHPALKMPALQLGDRVLFGSENVCRALAEQPSAKGRIVWPEELRTDVARNAQELIWHGMSAQVQIVFGTLVSGLPPDNVYFVKARAGFEGALRWLDEHMPSVLEALPSDRTVSLLEVTLFCLLEHLVFRTTLRLDAYPTLVRFAESFATRPSAESTPYRFDPRPSPTTGGADVP